MLLVYNLFPMARALIYIYSSTPDIHGPACYFDSSNPGSTFADGNVQTATKRTRDLDLKSYRRLMERAKGACRSKQTQ